MTSDNPFQSERLYSVREFRARAGLCERTVYNLFQSGELRAKHIGRKVAITNAAEWFDSLPAFRTGERAVGRAAA